MYFSIAILLLLGIIAYFHYVQGLFSSVISAVCAAVAAAMAFSFHEPLAQMIFTTKMTDQAYALMLIGLFVAIYLILRTIFDSAVPGNVRLPAIVDKVGGALFGAIAGAFAMGILAIAAQTMPFGASIGGYARYNLSEPREVRLPTRGQSEDAYTYDELKGGDLKEEDQSRMILPVDDFVVGFVSKMSDGGALSGERSVQSIHPAYLDEIFFNRMGTQVGASHVAVNTAKTQTVKITGAFALDHVEQAEAEIKEIRDRTDLRTLRSVGGKQLVVLRFTFSQGASDSDRVVRVGAASVRLVANGVNYLPKGTLHGDLLMASRADDFLIIEPDQPADFVFEVDAKDVLDGDKTKGFTFKQGAFAEAKRMARIDLSDMQVKAGLEEAASGVLRKATVALTPKTGPAKAPAPTPAPEPTPPPAPAAEPETSAPAEPATTQESPATKPDAAAEQTPDPGPAPIVFETLSVSNKLLVPLAVGDIDSDSTEIKHKSIVGTLKNKRFVRVEVRAKDPIEELVTGEGPVGEFYAPPGMKVVQVLASPANDSMQWASDLGKLELVDTKDKKYQTQGAMTRVGKNGKVFLLVKYDSEKPVTSIEKEDVERIDGELVLIYVVPQGTEIKQMSFGGKMLSTARLKVN